MAEAATVVARLGVTGAAVANREIAAFRQNLADVSKSARANRMEFAALARASRGMGLALSGMAAAGILAGRSFIKAATDAGVVSKELWKFQDAASDLKVTLGTQLLQVMGPVLEGLASFFNWLNKLNPNILKVGVAVAAIAVTFAAVAGPVFLLVAAIPAFAAGIGVLSVAFGALSISMGPITLIVLGIAAAVAAAIFIFRNWDTIMEALRGNFAGLDRVLGGLLSTLGLLSSDTGELSKRGMFLFAVLGALLGPLVPLVEKILSLRDVWDKLSAAWAKFSAFMSSNFPTLWSVMTDLVKAFGSFLRGDWDAMWTHLASAGKTHWEGIKSAWAGVGQFLLGKWQEFDAFMTERWPTFWGILKESASLVWNLLTGDWATAWENIKAIGAIAWAWIQEEWKVLWPKIKAEGKKAWDDITKDIKAWLSEQIPEVVKAAYDELKKQWAIFWEEDWPKIVQRGQDLVKALIRAGIQQITEEINNFIRWVNSLEIKLPWGKAIGLPNIPEIPTGPRPGSSDLPPLAGHGGNVQRGGSVIVGDRGLELVDMPRGARVTPLGPGGGAGGGLTVNYHQNGPVYGFLDFERQVAEAWANVKLAGGFRGVA